MATRAFYSVAQYIPDPARAEGANVGVVLFVPGADRPLVRLSPTLARVRKFFSAGKDDLTRIARDVDALRYRLQLRPHEFDEEAARAKFIATRADAVRITAPRLAVIHDSPAATLDALYADLVGEDEPAAPLAAPPRPALPPRLATVLDRLRAAGRAMGRQSLTVPTVGRKLDVAAAWENGVTNYVRPEPLTGPKLGGRLAGLGFNGRLIAAHPIDGHKGQLVVVSSDPAAEPKTEGRFRDTLAEFDVRFVPYAEADAYAAEVEREAH